MSNSIQEDAVVANLKMTHSYSMENQTEACKAKPTNNEDKQQKKATKVEFIQTKREPLGMEGDERSRAMLAMVGGHWLMSAP